MHSLQAIEKLLADAQAVVQKEKSIRIGQAVFNQMRIKYWIKYNPAVGTLEDFTSGGPESYWLQDDGTSFTDMFEMTNYAQVRALVYNEFWDGK